MTVDEIREAFLLIAQGRIGHDKVMALCEYLAKLGEKPKKKAD